jgi:CubicO group peptidase (beta-lactamase class C family)
MKISPNDDNTWTEVAPPAAGIEADRLEKVAHWLASRLSDRHFGAQLVVLRGGRVVLDRSVGSTNRDHEWLRQFFILARPIGGDV